MSDTSGQLAAALGAHSAAEQALAEAVLNRVAVLVADEATRRRQLELEVAALRAQLDALRGDVATVLAALKEREHGA